LVLAHPDGAPARVRVEETDLLGRATVEPDQPGVVLSLVGIRRLRDLLSVFERAALVAPEGETRPRETDRRR
jgi:hypothetical protein